MKKRILSVITAACTAMAAIPAISLPVSAADYTVWVNGVQLSSENTPLTVGGGTASYNAATNTLTLNEVTVDTAYKYSATAYYGIYSQNAIIIELVGENTITMPTVAAGEVTAEGTCVYGLGSRGNLTFTGTGSLTSTGANIEDTTPNYAGHKSYGIYASGNITLSGNPTVTGIGNELHGSNCVSAGVYSTGTISASSGSIQGSCVTSVDNNIYTALHGSNGKCYGVYGNSINLSGTAEITGTGGGISGTGGSNGSYSYGVYSESSITVSDTAHIIGNGGQVAANAAAFNSSYGIAAKENITAGNNTILTGTGGNAGYGSASGKAHSYGVAVTTNGGTLSISGKAEITGEGGPAKNNSYGISTTNTNVNYTNGILTGKASSSSTTPKGFNIAGLTSNGYKWRTDENGSYTLSTAAAFDTSVASLYAQIASANIVDPVTITPAQGSYTSVQTIAISCETEDATIKYTTDGTDPKTSPTAEIYNDSFTAEDSLTVRAYAYKDGMDPSAVTTIQYTINIPSVSTPTFSIPENTYDVAQTVLISCGTDDATIKYTTDGSDPKTSNTAVNYTGGISVPKTTTIKAYAFKDGMKNSEVATAVYTINLPLVNNPVISPAGGEFDEAQTVTVTCGTNGATIKYTTNGTEPSENNGTVCSGSITISNSCTLKVIAYKDGMNDSAVVSAVYEINIPEPTTTTTAAPPVTNPSDPVVTTTTTNSSDSPSDSSDTSSESPSGDTSDNPESPSDSTEETTVGADETSEPTQATIDSDDFTPPEEGSFPSTDDYSDITMNPELESSYESEFYNVTVKQSDGGTITPPNGENGKFTITPGGCFIIGDVLVNGVSVIDKMQGNSLMFDFESGDYTLEVKFVRVLTDDGNPSTGLDMAPLLIILGGAVTISAVLFISARKLRASKK